MAGSTYHARTPVGTAFVTVNSDVQGNVREVFVTVGRAGSDIAADAEAIGRLVSLAFRIPTSLPPRQVVDAVIDQLAGIGGSSWLGFGPKRVRSLADAVAHDLAEHSGRADQPSDAEDQRHTEDTRVPGPIQKMESRRTGDVCPSCGEMTLVNGEGYRKW